MKNGANRILKLKDVIRIVSRYTNNDAETCVVVADLINRGVIRLQGRYHHCKVVVG